MRATTERTGLAPEDVPLLAAIVLLPWAFGGVEMWAYRTAALLLAIAASLALWRCGWGGWGFDGSRRSIWLLPALLLGVWGALQVVPLPREVIRAISPETYRIYAASFPGYGGDGALPTLAAIEEMALGLVPEASGVPLPPDPDPPLEVEAPACFERSWRSLSLQPSATIERLTWYVALLLAFVVARQRLSDPEAAAVYRWAIFGLVTALGVFALIQSQTWNGKLYWVRPMTVDKQAFGPYVNPTNLAGVMELTAPWMAGYALSRYRRYGRAALRHGRFVAPMLGVAVALVATIGSASKAGVGLLACGLFVLVLCVISGWRARLAWALAAVAIVAASVLPLAQTRLGERFVEYTTRLHGDEIGEGRVSMARAAWEMALDFPVTGVGFGAFREVFPRYMPPGSTRWFNEAHNDYLEVLTDGGLVAAALVSWLAVAYALRAGRRLRPDGRRLSPSRVGMAIGIVALSVHALIDFNHQIPANALLFVTVCAMLLPATERDTELPEERR
jgi:O-antigen ligase